MRGRLIGAACALGVAGALDAQMIPAKPGLVLNYSHLQTDRNYDKQYLVTVVAADTNETIFKGFFLEDLAGKAPIIPDTVSRREWLGARAIGVGSGPDPLEHVRNRTVMALSKRVYQQLKREGKIEEYAVFVVVPDAGMMYRLQGSEQLVGTAPESLSVVIDGQPRTLPVLHTRGHYTQYSPMIDVTTENWYLDDPDLAWALKAEHVVGGKPYHLRLGTVETQSPGAGKMLDAALGTACRAEIYGIYFAYNSAEIPAISEPTMTQVAGVLKQHGDWTLTIEGHTDSIGGAKYNQELAARRAAAVKQRLVEHYGIAMSRLSTNGVGLAHPLAPNGTLEGRARNRRVELVRPCPGKK